MVSIGYSDTMYKWVDEDGNVDSTLITELNDIHTKVESWIRDKLKEFDTDVLDKLRKGILKVDELKGKALDHYSEYEKYVMATVLLFYVIKLTINLFQNTDFPSLFRLKYIQKLIRITWATIKDLAGSYGNLIRSTASMQDIVKLPKEGISNESEDWID